MSQKANLQTIRKYLRNINLFTFSSVEFSKGFIFLNFLQEFFRHKGILIIHSALNFISNKACLSLSLFITSSKIRFFLKTVFNCKNKKIPGKFSDFLLHKFKLLGINLFIIKIILLNQSCFDLKSNRFLKTLYLKLRSFKEGLFARRYNLFFDALKISYLFSRGFVQPNIFLYVLAQIFKVLPKRKHSRFLLFLKKLFKTLIDTKDSKVSTSKHSLGGLKFLISGKLKGKLRTQKNFIQSGKVPTQTLSKNIEYSKLHVFTRLGVFGFKLWIYRL